MKKKKGLTLIELLAVIAIIAILFVLLIPQINNAIDKARASGVQTDLHSFEVGIRAYLMENDGLSYSVDGINKNLDNALLFENFISKKKSPWGTDYILSIDGDEVSIHTTKNNNEKITYGVKIRDVKGEINHTYFGFDEKINEEKFIYEETLCEYRTISENHRDDFEVTPVTGGVRIDKYVGSSKDVVIPCEIDGEPVVEIAGTSAVTKGSFAFKDLTSVIIPNTVAKIGNLAFVENKLNKLILPNSVTKIGVYSFDSNEISSLILPSSLSVIEQNSFSSNKLTNVTIPEGVKMINSVAFAVNKLADIRLPDSLTTINRRAFVSNNLSHVIIPKNVSSVGTNAFYDNPKLKTITNLSAFDFTTNPTEYFNSEPVIN